MPLRQPSVYKCFIKCSQQAVQAASAPTNARNHQLGKLEWIAQSLEQHIAVHTVFAIGAQVFANNHAVALQTARRGAASAPADLTL